MIAANTYNNDSIKHYLQMTAANTPNNDSNIFFPFVQKLGAIGEGL